MAAAPASPFILRLGMRARTGGLPLGLGFFWVWSAFAQSQVALGARGAFRLTERRSLGATARLVVRVL
jgi:hypothetical protein